MYILNTDNICPVFDIKAEVVLTAITRYQLWAIYPKIGD